MLKGAENEEGGGRLPFSSPPFSSSLLALLGGTGKEGSSSAVLLCTSTHALYPRRSVGGGCMIYIAKKVKLSLSVDPYPYLARPVSSEM